MQCDIPKSEVDTLCEEIKRQMSTLDIGQDTINGTTIIVIHPENWEVSLLVPYRNINTREIRKKIERIIFEKCGIEQNCCDYLGKQKGKAAFEWYFRHPNVPKDIYDRLEMEMEQELGGEESMGIPTPSGFLSRSDTAFITIKEEFFDAIAKGKKKKETRRLNQYYCDKFFSPGVKKKFIRINRGYKTGAENQMVFEIKQINIVSRAGEEISAYDKDGNPLTSLSHIPQHFVPVAYNIVLGERKR